MATSSPVNTKTSDNLEPEDNCMSPEHNLTNFLEVHIKETTKDVEYHNKGCKKDTNIEKSHKKKRKNKKKTSICSICSKAFADVSNMKRHFVTHTGYKDFQCAICNKLFTMKSSLTRHLKIHQGIKDFHCDLCDKSFTQNSHLKDHKTVHTGLKEFQCKICEKSFSRSDKLRKHMILHETNEAQCYICHRYTNPCNLDRHIKGHNREKNLACEMCGKMFSDRSNLQKHLKVHSGTKDYKCAVCGKLYSRMDKLKRHIINYHDVETRNECVTESSKT